MIRAPYTVFPCPLQGASHPPLTGKRATDLLENMRRFTPPAGTAAETASSGAAHLLCASNLRGGTPTKATVSSRGAQKRRAIKARKRAGKWTDRDRDLAEREMAVVIVERQKVKVT